MSSKHFINSGFDTIEAFCSGGRVQHLVFTTVLATSQCMTLDFIDCSFESSKSFGSIWWLVEILVGRNDLS